MAVIRQEAISSVMRWSGTAVAAALIVVGPTVTAHAQTSELMSWTVAQTGDPYPDRVGEVYESFGPAVQDEFGVLARAVGDGGSDGIIDFRNRATGGTPLVTDLSPTPVGATYESFDPDLISADDQSDHVVFVASVGGTRGVFLHDGGPTQYRVAEQTDVIPGTTSTIADFHLLAFADGKIILAATLNPGGTASDPLEGVYLIPAEDIIAGTGSLETVFDTATNVPDASGETFSEFHALGGRGRSLATIAVTSTARKVVALHNAGTAQQRVLVSTGDAVPGGSGNFADFTALDVTDNMVGVATLNDSGGSMLFLYTVLSGLTAKPGNPSISLLGTSVPVNGTPPQVPLGIRDRQIAISARFVTALTDLPGDQLGIHWGLIGGSELHKLTATGNPFGSGIVNNLKMTSESLEGTRATINIGVKEGSTLREVLQTYRVSNLGELDALVMPRLQVVTETHLFNGAATPGGMTFVGKNSLASELQGRFESLPFDGDFSGLPFSVPPPQPDPVPELIPFWHFQWFDEHGGLIQNPGPDFTLHLGLINGLSDGPVGVHGYDTSGNKWVELNTWIEPGTNQVRLDLDHFSWLSIGEDRAPQPQITSLGKIPFLSRLFVNCTSSRPKEELLIFVTASLVEDERSLSIVQPLSGPTLPHSGWPLDPSIEIEEVDIGRYVIHWTPTGDEGYLQVGVNPRP